MICLLTAHPTESIGQIVTSPRMRVKVISRSRWRIYVCAKIMLKRLTGQLLPFKGRHYCPSKYARIRLNGHSFSNFKCISLLSPALKASCLTGIFYRPINIALQNVGLRE